MKAKRILEFRTSYDIDEKKFIEGSVIQDDTKVASATNPQDHLKNSYQIAERLGIINPI